MKSLAVNIYMERERLPLYRINLIFYNSSSFYFQAASHLEEYNEMLEFILKWIEKAKILVHGSVTWNSASQLRDQFKAYQVIK